MAHFLRDERITNLTIDKGCIVQLASIFDTRAKSLNNDPSKEDSKFLFYIIRFDNKGYKVFSIEELLKYFDQAKEIERIILTAETGSSITSNRAIGTHLELRFDSRDVNNCFITVASDDSDWVDASFSAIHETLHKFKNKNFWARSAWMDLCIQLGGVFIGFVVSLWATVIISPKIAIENSFVITFLFTFLIFSNTWGYFKSLVLRVVNKFFPNLKFYRSAKDRLHWFMQAIIGGISAGIILYLLGKGFSFIGNLLGEITTKNL